MRCTLQKTESIITVRGPLSFSVRLRALTRSRRLRSLPVRHVRVIDDGDDCSGGVIDDNVISVNVLRSFTFVSVYDGNARVRAMFWWSIYL